MDCVRFKVLGLCASLVLAGVSRAGTINPPAVTWNQGPVPFITLFTCMNQLSAQFPTATANFEEELVEAAEEWFIGSGANVRFYYMGSLTAADPACADMPTTIPPLIVGAPPLGPEPPRWSVVLTAAPTLKSQLFPVGTNPCKFAVTDLWTVPPLAGSSTRPSIERARITLVRNQDCSGALAPWPWPDSFAPLPQTLGFGRVLMNMLGHALGLSDEIGGTDSVMAPIDPNVSLNRWHLSDPIVSVMRSAYGTAKSSPMWIETKDNGKTWTALMGTPHANSANSLGLAACQSMMPSASRQSAYLVAETILDSNAKSEVVTYFVDPSRRGFSNQVSHGISNRKPTLTCTREAYILGMVDPAGDIRISRSTDGVHWKGSTVPGGWQSAHAPILAYVPWIKGVLAGTSTTTDYLRFLLSRDDGVTFQLASSFGSLWQPRFPFGVSCPSATRRCYVAFGDEGFSVFTNEIQGGNLVGLSYGGGGEIPNLGLVMAQSPNGRGYFLARRYKPGYKFSLTPNAALDQVGGGLQADSTQIPWTFTNQPFSRLVSDSPLGLFSDLSHRSYIALSTWNYWYNGYGFVVASRPAVTPKNEDHQDLDPASDPTQERSRISDAIGLRMPQSN